MPRPTANDWSLKTQYGSVVLSLEKHSGQNVHGRFSACAAKLRESSTDRKADDVLDWKAMGAASIDPFNDTRHWPSCGIEFEESDFCTSGNWTIDSKPVLEMARAPLVMLNSKMDFMSNEVYVVMSIRRRSVVQKLWTL